MPQVGQLAERAEEQETRVNELIDHTADIVATQTEARAEQLSDKINEGAARLSEKGNDVAAQASDVVLAQAHMVCSQCLCLITLDEFDYLQQLHSLAQPL